MGEKKKSTINFFLVISAILGFYLGFTGKSLGSLGLTGESLYFGIPSLFILLFIVGYIYIREIKELLISNEL